MKQNLLPLLVAFFPIALFAQITDLPVIAQAGPDTKTIADTEFLIPSYSTTTALNDKTNSYHDDLLNGWMSYANYASFLLAGISQKHGYLSVSTTINPAYFLMHPVVGESTDAPVMDVPHQMEGIVEDEKQRTELEADRKNVMSLDIFPNPVSTGIISLKFGDWDAAEISMFDASGQLVEKTSSKFGNKTVIDVNHLPNGIYIFEAQQNGTFYVDQLVIQK